MLVRSLDVRNFKNEEDGKISFTSGINVIYGENAAGKTNLLEGIFLFAAGKSFRGCKDRELIKFGFDSADVSLGFSDRVSNKNFAIKLFKGPHRQIFREGIKITKMSEFLGVFRAVIFTPEHLNLVKGAPECRRRFIDMAICQSFPRYVAGVNEYAKLLSQKNAFLKNGVENDSLLSVYNERLAVCAGTITVNRMGFLHMLQEESGPFHADMTGGNEKLEIKYISQAGDDCSDAKEITKRYLNLFEKRMENEKWRRMSLIGPHKDDFEVLINGKNAKTYGSQGQQRSAVLSMKLAEGELSKRLTGEYPVFLLDDVLSELDGGRKQYILSRITTGQVIITGCETEYFKNLNAANKLLIRDGKVCSCT